MPTDFTDSLFEALGQPALSSPLHAQYFSQTEIEICGESPYLNAMGAGISLPLSKKHKIDAIHLYSGTLEGFCRFEGATPFGIGFDMTRAQIREKLGEPAMSADPSGTGLFAITHSYDRYEDDRFYVRYQFEAGDCAVRLITLGLV
jgi:hypothetical protein